MRHTCEWIVLVCPHCERVCDDPEHLIERQCGKPAVAHIDWGTGTVYWYCAEHFDERIEQIRNAGRRDVLEASGVR